jgi:putative transposase
MKTSRFTKSQSVGVLKQVDAGAKVGTIVGNIVFALRRIKDPEEENDRLNRMFAELSLTHEATKALIKKR